MPKDLEQLLRKTLCKAEADFVVANYNLYFTGYGHLTPRQFLRNCRVIVAKNQMKF